MINPKRLELIAGGGLAMGLGEALKEEVTFDRSKVRVPTGAATAILTMEEMPDVKVVQISRDDKGFGSGGEAPNALAPPAVVAAFFDATGVQARRIPLTPESSKPSSPRCLVENISRPVRTRGTSISAGRDLSIQRLHPRSFFLEIGNCEVFVQPTDDDEHERDGHKEQQGDSRPAGPRQRHYAQHRQVERQEIPGTGLSSEMRT